MRAYPASPSFCSLSSVGTTVVRTCIKIDAVTYGTIPSAKSESRDKADPESRFSSPRIELPLEPRNCDTACGSTPGDGTHVPRR
jgi:hypothetical protein